MFWNPHKHMDDTISIGVAAPASSEAWPCTGVMHRQSGEIRGAAPHGSLQEAGSEKRNPN